MLQAAAPRPGPTSAQLAVILAKRDRRVLFATLPLVGSSIRVRVGACLQWHGYEGDRLYLTQRDPANPVDRLVLSGVTRPYEE